MIDRMNFIKFFAVTLIICFANSVVAIAQTNLQNQQEAKQQLTPVAKDIVKRKLGDSENVFQVARKIVVGGQPDASDLTRIKKSGYKRVLNLYRSKEQSFDEKKTCKKLGLQYQHLPFDNEKQLNDEIFNQVRIALLDSDQTPVFIHCKSNDRSAAVWAAYRTLDQGMNLETAIKEARAMGLKTDGYEQKLRQYVARMLGGPVISTVSDSPSFISTTINETYYPAETGTAIYQAQPIVMPAPS